MTVADDFMFGLAIGNGRRANAAAAAAYAGAQALNELAPHIADLKNEIATLKRQAQIDEANIAGLIAQVDALKAECPNSPLLAPTGKKFKKSGNPKTHLRSVFEKVFDAALRTTGITTPEAFRLD